MALKSIRIGPADNVIQYDDGEFSSAIQTTESIDVGGIVSGALPTATPVDGDLLMFRDVSNGDAISTCTFAQLKTYLGL